MFESLSVEEAAHGSETDPASTPVVEQRGSATDVETTHTTAALQRFFAGLAATTGVGLGDAERIDQLTVLEQIKSAVCAAQARITVEFDASQRARAAERGLPAAQQGQGIAAQVALARRESPHRAAGHVGLAKALVREMPHTLAALATGQTSEWRAIVMVRETAALSAEHRTQVDREVGARLADLGDRAVQVEARKVGYRLDPASLVRRIARAEADRTVSIRPAPDAMTYLTGVLPVAQGVAAYAALRQRAESLRSAGDERSLGQLMADTLVARVTGLEDGVSPDVEIQLVMTDETLFSDNCGDGAEGDEPATVSGHGTTPDPIPAWLARRIVTDAHRVWIRRLYTSPDGTTVVDADPRRRLFGDVERSFFVARDQWCRTPWCGAPIRHADHIVRHADGGATTITDGQGLCVACNQAKEAAGWLSRIDTDTRRHRVIITTPTGHTYKSEPPQPPGVSARSMIGDLELYLTDLSVDVFAARSG